MDHKFITAATLAALLGTGCAQMQGVPSAERFPAADLKKVKSAQHWDVIASDVAAQTASVLKGLPDGRNRPLYVAAPGNGTFPLAFRSLLISRLLGQGLPVSTQQDGAATVRYESQVIRHTDGRAQVPGGVEIATLAGGILVARQIGVSNASNTARFATATALVAGSALASAAGQYSRPTNTELIITTTIASGGRYLLSKSDVYYVEDADGAMYDSASSTKRMEVVGP